MWVLHLLKLGTVDLKPMKNKCMGPNLGYIQQTLFAVKLLNVLMVKHMWEDRFPCCSEEGMKAKCVKSRVLILPEQRWFKQKVSIALCIRYLLPPSCF